MPTRLFRAIPSEAKTLWLVSCLALTLTACTTAPMNRDATLYTYSTIDALLSGAYDGDLTIGELGRKGDFGLGTFNRLDGEMIALGGVFYHFRADGSVTVANPGDKTPLAYVLPFKPTMAFALEPALQATSLPAIEAFLDTSLPNKNMFYAVDITGDFADITTRAIAAQVRPYRPLAELVKTQNLFNRTSVSGTLVGIRSPAFSKGFSVPGWHWHFISSDRSYGGHVLKIGSSKGTVKITTADRVDMELPGTEDFANSDQTKDRSAELHLVEKEKP